MSPGLRSVFRLDLTDKVLHILLEPCHCDNIQNTYIVLLVTSYNNVCVHDYCEQLLLIVGGWLLGNNDASM